MPDSGRPARSIDDVTVLLGFGSVCFDLKVCGLADGAAGLAEVKVLDPT